MAAPQSLEKHNAPQPTNMGERERSQRVKVKDKAVERFHIFFFFYVQFRHTGPRELTCIRYTTLYKC